MRNTWRRSGCTNCQSLTRLEADREAVAATDTEGLGADIDEVVYDLFNLTDDDPEVVEEFQVRSDSIGDSLCQYPY